MKMIESEQYQALVKRRAEEYAQSKDDHWYENIPPEEMVKSGFRMGALDPVLEEARRAMYRAEAFDAAIDLCRKKYLALRGDKTSEFGDGCAGAYCEIISDLQLMAKAEREKLKKILEGNKA